ncbi:hypothetical protein K8Q94_00205 [Candidatus Nomurabacteria bacterium]|nr:hypothetical protein [Candidatus Nomurabacteria bacterium]
MNLFLVNTAYASDNLGKFIGNVNKQIINPLIVLLFALALVYFLYGVFEFLSNAENEESKTKGKMHMIYGLIGFTIMMGVWSILAMLQNTFNIPKSQIDPEKGTVNLPSYNP